MKIDGACHCGAIRYEAEVDPARVMICHCSDCQSLSCSAFRTVAPAPKASFHRLCGQPKIYEKTTADSGNKRTQAFCANCGTPIYSSPVSAEFPFYSLRVGTIRQRAELRPSAEYFCRSKLGWTGLEGTRRFETMPG